MCEIFFVTNVKFQIWWYLINTGNPLRKTRHLPFLQVVQQGFEHKKKFNKMQNQMDRIKAILTNLL
jgi:hypothetical protein